MKHRGAGNVASSNANFCFLVLLTIALLPLTFFSQSALAQNGLSQSGLAEEPPADVAPPPFKRLSNTEKQKLESEPGLKKRTELSLDLMEERLLNAEKFSSRDDYKNSLDNLAGFQALLENTFGYLEKNDRRNKADNRFKQLEIFLRRQVPRLETMRRSMPYRYGYYVLKLMRVVRETRAKAVEPLFSDSVVKSEDS